jgi:hypothetical protein
MVEADVVGCENISTALTDASTIPQHLHHVVNIVVTDLIQRIPGHSWPDFFHSSAPAPAYGVRIHKPHVVGCAQGGERIVRRFYLLTD